ncbi:hypothetical protein [Halomicrobium salinisoli]|uniref:hypothetical protein n=1 Tax=Halomicrobium salinisoli TaxID=2878391 RepID=UPI001CEFEE36|nr:hypothetical protein [Halomicrobium salinisoli]
MSSDAGGAPSDGGIASCVRSAASVRALALLCAGVLTGAGVSLLGSGAVAVPVIGSVPGTPLGAVGIAAAVVMYQRGGCCADCGEKACGCTGNCGDSCSYDG